ncbi:response regulator [Paeniglutamicibacter kerguelensis]|uniref:DNA-binding NarL/FixJ family response regulator n=1 Tax=Paeniglutamicibacter kerguelensis TaxID=254788 RepID=A0ABS4X816_9MICC|nr:response regulator transcription factor [Paeniglutamicibacter kerguelensis]MBP2384496.1 DNA-binding NarL/FixJ family response regulator [Paeniglutamicibacter kerguelensis]
MIRLMIVDDHPVVRAGLRALIDSQEDLEVVAEAGNLTDAVAAALEFQPHVTLMDLHLGAENPGGIEITAALRGLKHAPEVLVLTTYDTEADIVRALQAGARGYLLKDAPPNDLFAGIRATARGETALAPSVAAALVRRTSNHGAGVTEREVQVLDLLAKGLGNKDIARELFVSEGTVKSHLAHVYTKLGVDSRAGAVAVAIERRIIRA